jgi:hypothetical protein
MHAGPRPKLPVRRRRGAKLLGKMGLFCKKRFFAFPSPLIREPNFRSPGSRKQYTPLRTKW